MAFHSDDAAGIAPQNLPAKDLFEPALYQRAIYKLRLDLQHPERVDGDGSNLIAGATGTIIAAALLMTPPKPLEFPALRDRCRAIHKKEVWAQTGP